MHNLSRAALMLSALVVAGLARTSLAQQASGSLDPTRRGGCPSDGGPPGDAQKVPGGTQRGRDRGGVVEACQTGGAPRLDPGNFPDGVLPANVPPPARENHPPVQSSHSDSAPRCSGNRATTEQFVDADPPYQGWGWFQHSRPELAVDDAEDPTMLRIYLGRSDVLDFSPVAGSNPQVFVGVNGVQGVVARLPGTSTEPELYVHYDDRGNVFTYFGHHVPSGAVDMHGAKGQHWKTQSADAGGGAATYYVGHATDPAEALLEGFVLDEGAPTARCIAAVDGAGRTWEYTYGTQIGAQPMLTKIEIEDDSTLVWKIEYEYYTSDESGKGSTGDLKSSTETSPLSSGGNAVYTNYFRYYGIETIGGNSYDMRHLIKLHVGPEGARRAAAESVTLSSATPSLPTPTSAQGTSSARRSTRRT